MIIKSRPSKSSRLSFHHDNFPRFVDIWNFIDVAFSTFMANQRNNENLIGHLPLTPFSMTYTKKNNMICMLLMFAQH